MGAGISKSGGASISINWGDAFKDTSKVAKKINSDSVKKKIVKELHREVPDDAAINGFVKVVKDLDRVLNSFKGDDWKRLVKAAGDTAGSASTRALTPADYADIVAKVGGLIGLPGTADAKTVKEKWSKEVSTPIQGFVQSSLGLDLSADKKRMICLCTRGLLHGVYGVYLMSLLCIRLGVK